jgi:hypothetical protein
VSRSNGLIAEQAINAPNVDRLLVTMPHKRAVFGHCATSSERATLLVVVYYLAPLNRRLDAGTWIESCWGWWSSPSSSTMRRGRSPHPTSRICA